MRSLRTVTAALLAAALLGTSAVPAVAFGVGRDDATSAKSARLHQAASASRGPRIQAGRVLVRVKGDTTAAKLQRIYRSADTSSGAVRVIHGDILSWRVPAGTSDADFAAKLEATGEVAYAELNYSRKLADVYVLPTYKAPDDTAYLDTGTWLIENPFTHAVYNKFPNAKSWWLRDIHATEMWSQAYTGPDVVGKFPLRAADATITVAVLDTGFWKDHPDAGNVESGWDCYSNDNDVTPPDPATIAVPTKNLTPEQIHADQVMIASHGTNVAGLVGAGTANGIGSFGSGYDTEVRMYKVSGVNTAGDLLIPDAAVVSAITRAADDGCKIISMSFVDYSDSLAIREAVDYAYGKGCLIVAARGNEGTSALLYPAVLPHVVGVGALTKGANGVDTTRAYFSSTGNGLDLSAPGQKIWGLTKPLEGDAAQPGYDWWDGTSMATPITAGALAVLWRAAPDLSADEIVAVAQSSATDLGAAGWDANTGWGEIDLNAAYEKLKTTYPHLQKPAEISPIVDPSTRGIPVSWAPVAGYQVRYNVDVDGIRVASNLTTTHTALPAVTPGTHTLTISPTSARNWTDSTEVTTTQFEATRSYPVMLDASFSGTTLAWKSTEPAAQASYRVRIDGGATETVSAEELDLEALAYGMHSASISVVDSASAESAATSLSFRRWPSPTVTRTGGADRFAVNADLARQTFTTAETVVLVAGEKWPDALSASPLAAKLNAPVLLSRATSLPSVSKYAMLQLGTKKVVIVGGTGSVSEGVANTLRSSGISVSRISGPDRYTTANAVARELWKLGGNSIPDNKALVASGLTHQDALIATAVGARKGWPVLLTGKASVPASTRSTLSAIGVKSTVLIGTASSVSAVAASQLPAATRLQASTAPGTSVQVATWATTNYPTDFIGERYYIASSQSDKFADSLGVGVPAGRSGGLLLLTAPALSPEISAYYTAHRADATTTKIVGGTATIPNSAMTAIKALVGAP